MVTQERLRELFDYDPPDQARPLVRRVGVPGGRTSRVGDRPGSPNSEGYLRVMVDGRRYQLHVLVLIWHGWSPPAGSVADHRDGDNQHNLIENLRYASRSQNAANRRKKVGVSRYLGVSWNKRAGKWISQLSRQGKRVHHAYHADEEDAARAYDAAAIEQHGEFARTNFPQKELA